MDRFIDNYFDDSSASLDRVLEVRVTDESLCDRTSELYEKIYEVGVVKVGELLLEKFPVSSKDGYHIYYGRFLPPQHG